MTGASLGSHWGLADVEAFAHGELDAIMSPEDEGQISYGHEILRTAATEREIYGLSTGVGARRFVAVERDANSCLRLWQAHALQIGERVDPLRTRAALLIRAVQIAQGGSGVSPALAAGTLESARASELPEIRFGTSLGTGDIAAMASIALQLANRGVRFSPSDGLPFMSSGALTFADAAITLRSLQRALKAGIELTGLVTRVLRSTPEHFSNSALKDQSSEVREVASRLRAIRGNKPATRVQEPFSIRLAPHSHGSITKAWKAAAVAVETGINAAFENPVVLENGGIAHVGNFYTIELALAIDGLLRALAHEASLAASRLSLLLDTRFTGASDFLSDGSADATGAMMLEYAAAAAVAEVREAAAAHGAYGVSVSQGAEEHAPFTAHAIRRLVRSEQAYRTILACLGVALGRLPGGVERTRGLHDSASALGDRDLSGELNTMLQHLDTVEVSVS